LFLFTRRHLHLMLLETGIVSRTFGMDFIYFDLMFIAIYIGFMIKKKYWMPLIWGMIGWMVYIICEVVIWVNIMDVRHYTGPLIGGVFFTWLTFSPGFIQFSYVFIMFEKRNRKELIFWSILYIGGWTLVGTLSQLLPIDDRMIFLYREMKEGVISQRLIEVIMVGINVVIAGVLVKMKKIRINDALFIFLVGTLVEFSLEFSMAVSGIRQAQGTWSFEMFIFNTFFEFNLGSVLMYLIFVLFKVKRDKHYYNPLSFQDLKFISTDFNAVATICNNSDIDNKRMKEYAQLYKLEKFVSELKYYSETYLSKELLVELEENISKFWQ
jgi:hypothetical protein